MDGAELDGLRLGALIHDIGKISVPAEILAKPGRLSDVEFNLIKQHPQAGYDILAVIDFGRPVAEMVLQHHERLDGSGYPQGPAGRRADAGGPHPRGRRRGGGDVVAPALPRGAGHWRRRSPRSATAPATRYDAEVVAACVRVIDGAGLRGSRRELRRRAGGAAGASSPRGRRPRRAVQRTCAP